jgi:hypothetical protein
VQGLARDDVERKKFLKMAGRKMGAGAGGTPVKKPTFSFPVTDQASFLKLAHVLENTGVGAYNGAGPHSQTRSSSPRPVDRPDRGASRRFDRSADRRFGDAQRRV